MSVAFRSSGSLYVYRPLTNVLKCRLRALIVAGIFKLSKKNIVKDGGVMYVDHEREATAERFKNILGVTMANLTAISVLF